MSKSERTIARRERGPRNPITPRERALRADPNIRLKLRPGRKPGAQIARVNAEPDDLRAYLRTADARAAEPWQLAALASLRETLGAPLDVQAYEELRAAIVKGAKRWRASGLAR